MSGPDVTTIIGVRPIFEVGCLHQIPHSKVMFRGGRTDFWITIPQESPDRKSAHVRNFFEVKGNAPYPSQSACNIA